jgi:hypothetical protein
VVLDFRCKLPECAVRASVAGTGYPCGTACVLAIAGVAPLGGAQVTKHKNYSVFHGGWKRLTSNREALPILWPEHYTTDNTSPPVDQSRHVVVSPSEEEERYDSNSDRSSLELCDWDGNRGFDGHRVLSAHRQLPLPNVISEVNEVGCTVIYEGEGKYN